MYKLYNGDCLDVLDGIADGVIDLTVTSPPYDNLRSYGSVASWSFDVFQRVAIELYRVTKDGGVVVWVVADATIDGSETGTSFRQALFFKETGFNLHDTMIWLKPNSIPLTHRRYEQKFEFMFVLSKGRPKTFNPIMEDCIYSGDAYSFRVPERDDSHAFRERAEKRTVRQRKQAGNCWSYLVGGGHVTKDKVAYKHPAVFPDKLARDHIISWSNEGDIVLDPFMGSGTTGKMALMNNRRFVGIEVNSDYFKIVEERLSKVNNSFYGILMDLTAGCDTIEK